MSALRRILASIAVLTALAGSKVQADVNILYYSDFTAGTDNMASALAGLPSTYSVTTASSSTDFQTKLSGGGFNLAIYFTQGYYPVDSVFTGIGNFVSGGGKAVLDEWYTSDPTPLAPFSASFTGNNNQESVTITDSKLATGITNSIALMNPGWYIFSTGLNGSYVAATFPNSDGAIVIGNNGRSIVNGFLSDTFVNESQGVQFYTNEIASLTTPTTVTPEPSTLSIMAVSVLACAGYGLRRRFTA